MTSRREIKKQLVESVSVGANADSVNSKKESSAFMKGAVSSFLALGIGAAVYNWTSSSAGETAQEPKQVELDVEGNPMFLYSGDLEQDTASEVSLVTQKTAVVKQVQQVAEAKNGTASNETAKNDTSDKNQTTDDDDKQVVVIDEGSSTNVIPHQFWTKATEPGKDWGVGLAQGKELIVLKSWEGLWVSQNSDMTQPNDDSYMKADREENGSWEKFKPIYLGNHEFAFQAWSGKYLSCDDSHVMQASREVVNEWEKFYIYATNEKDLGSPDNGDKYIALKSKYWGTWVSVGEDKVLWCNTMVPSTWEKFTGWSQ